MHSLHLPTVSSTQTYLKENFDQLNQDIIVSTSYQDAGHGRRGSEWKHFDYALSFSFTIKPNECMTLTPLEIGCLLADFFSPNIQLKWPNDLINPKKEKVGGIICQLIEGVIVAGVGINLYLPQQEDNHGFPYPVGGVFTEKENFTSDFQSEIPKKIYQYILENRLTSAQVQSQFSRHCSHLNQQVQIIDHQTTNAGEFIGISSQGEALLQQEDQVSKVLTGSLRIN